MDFFRNRRRERVIAEPFPVQWERIVARNVSAYARLAEDDRRELLDHTAVLLAEKHFEGAGGFELTDEIRVTIAAQASVLLLHRDTDYYPRLKSIIVYPSTYVVSGERYMGDGLWEEGDDAHLGHTSPSLGALVIAWDDALRGARSLDDGTNVVLHEFAHQLDFEDDLVDGTPPLARHQYRSWARVLSAEYDELREAADRDRRTLIDQYGATNPAEFFAVVTELFFERPQRLREKHPELYAELQAFYRQDPAGWSAADVASGDFPVPD